MKNRERGRAHCTECQNVGCGCGAPPFSILDLLCIFIVTLIFGLSFLGGFVAP